MFSDMKSVGILVGKKCNLGKWGLEGQDFDSSLVFPFWRLREGYIIIRDSYSRGTKFFKDRFGAIEKLYIPSTYHGAWQLYSFFLQVLE